MDTRSSSPSSGEPNGVAPFGPCTDVCRLERSGSVCSFDGGIGGCSGSEVEVLAPKGPSGSCDPSTASSLVAGTATFLVARGPLPDAVRGEAIAGDSVFGVVEEVPAPN